jgi:dipeptidyl aminopeptidase/acylaminoacyl peptidase
MDLLSAFLPRHTGKKSRVLFRASALALMAHAYLHAQGTKADYQRAAELDQKFQGLTVNVPGPVAWIGDSPRCWYRKSVTGGHQFVMVDAERLTKKPAFDHQAIAAALSNATGKNYTAITLPFESIAFSEDEAVIEIRANGSEWKCTLADSRCVKQEPPAAKKPAPEPATKKSPDGAWEALIRNFNVFLRPLKSGGKAEAFALSTDGAEGDAYQLDSIAWAPDSKHIAAMRVQPGYQREVHYIESSPADQLQPKHFTRNYPKPGDALDIRHPVLFDVEAKKPIDIDNALFPNPWELAIIGWFKNSRQVALLYNQRGHQLLRMIVVDANTGAARTVVTEESRTFIDYTPLQGDMEDSGKMFVSDMNDEKEIIWASERDGWEHLYLFDAATGKLKNQITRGEWPVRAVDYVDKAGRQIWFRASGTYPGQDPYFFHYYRVNADGTGLTAFTEANGNHEVSFSADRKYYVDTWSRVDLAPIAQLRRTSDRKVLMELERGDLTALRAAGWQTPEPFAAKGRDGKTDIWGVIFKPTNFDPSKKYPVIENIYAGPQGSDVPKSFSINPQPLAELGFIVVQIDGMGTNNRSRAFHDVTWQNLADGGFPDRILWHKAVAAKYPWYDITRVGIYGGSAGGQHALGALLFHPEFYQVAVSDSGCHDNRMDKIWWNEQWMGWPVGPQYAASSNVDNAYRLQGKLLLIVGELDDNVDPASTFQVVNALIKANKRFDLLVVPGGGHAPGGAYSVHLLQDFFVHNLLGVEPPEWNR